MDHDNHMDHGTELTGEKKGTDSLGSTAFREESGADVPGSTAFREESGADIPGSTAFGEEEPAEKTASPLTGFSWLQQELEKDRQEKEEQRLAQQEAGKSAETFRPDPAVNSQSRRPEFNDRPHVSDPAGNGGFPPQKMPAGGPDFHRPEPNGNGGHPGGKNHGGNKWATVVSMAVVFGLIAGLLMFGVNAVGTQLLGKAKTENTSSAGNAEAQKEKIGGRISKKSENTEVLRSSSEKAAPAENGGGSVAKVAADCMPSLVTISTMSVQEMRSFFGGSRKYQVQGAGTGVIIGQNEDELLIATNNHVVEGAQQLSVGFVDESAIEGRIKGTDPDNDLAVVAVALSDIPEKTQKEIKAAVIGDSDELALGEQVVAIGNALGYGQSVTSGYVSGLNRTLRFQDGNEVFTSDGLIQTDAAINSGNSGGALLNMKGELVGINEAKSSSGAGEASVDNIGYAIPLAKAEPILQDLMKQKTRAAVKSEEQGYLGVTCADVTSEYAEMYNMPEGVCFTSVVPGGPADQAGIRKGDVLTAFDGKKVKSYEKLQSIMQYYRSGETIEVTVQHQEKDGYSEKKVSLTLGDQNILEQAQQGAGQEAQQPDGSRGQNGGQENGQEQEDAQGKSPYDLFREFFGDDF